MRSVRESDTIDLGWSVNEVLYLRPVTIEVLNRFGIDVCCGGNDTLREAAEQAGVDAGLLLHELRYAAEAE